MKKLTSQIIAIERQLSKRRLTIRELCDAARIDESGWRRWRRGGQPLAKTWRRVEAAVDKLIGEQS